jgi:hypothetical protein
MNIKLELQFDEEDYKSMYPEATNEDLIAIFKEDFVDTIFREWTEDEVLQSLEVVEVN